MAPNSTFRELEHKVSSRTTNILQNIERAQWITTYNRNFTGKHFVVVANLLGIAIKGHKMLSPSSLKDTHFL